MPFVGPTHSNYCRSFWDKEAFKASFNSFSVRLLSNDHLIIVIEIEQAEVISGQYVTFFEVVS